MKNEIVFKNDGSFELPKYFKELFVKGMSYSVMLKVGEGIVFLPLWQMGYTPEIPLKYDEVKEDGYLKIPTGMMQLFQKHNFTMICFPYNALGRDGVLITNKPNVSQPDFLWKRSDIIVTLSPWGIPHRPQKLFHEEIKRDYPNSKFVIKRRKKKTMEE